MTYESKRDLRTIKTERALKSALYELLEKQPLESITVKELTVHAEVARATFYQYYDSLSDMLASIEADLLQTYVDGINEIAGDTTDYAEFCKRSLLYTLKDTVRVLPFARLVYQDKLKTQNIGKCIVALESAAINKIPQDKRNSDVSIAVKYAIYGCLAVLRDWVIHETSDYSAEVLADKLLVLISSSLYDRS